MDGSTVAGVRGRVDAAAGSRHYGGGMHVLILQPRSNAVSETFLRTQARLLPHLLPGGGHRVTAAAGLPVPRVDGTPVLPEGRLARLRRVAPRAPAAARSLLWPPDTRRTLRRLEWDETTDRLLDRFRPDAVLAQFGPTGAMVAPGCRKAGVPLVVHFHGHDASQADALAEWSAGYRAMFPDVAAVVAVSGPMRDTLLGLGAPPDRTHLIPYGVDTGEFCGADPAAAGPVALAVGRFVPKKAPDLLVRAFAAARDAVPDARLRMIGDGPLLAGCRDLARDLGVADAVAFLGEQPPEVVREEMRAARLFAQHSVRAADGNSEGSPVAVTEAAACGLPVVSTRHANIPRIVRDGETGLLADERDVPAFARHLAALLADRERAGAMGAAARAHAAGRFDARGQVSKLAALLADAAARPVPAVNVVPAAVRGDRLHPRRSSRVHWHLTALRDAYAAAIDAHLPGPNDRPRLLDLGCGTMPYRPLFAPRLEARGGAYVGADLAGNDAADLAVAETGRVACDDGAFDVVLSSQVLEHVADPDAYLREAHRVLKPGGLLLLSTHGVWSYHPDPRDLWRWTCEGLRTLVARCGFDLLEQTGVMGPEATALQLRQDAKIRRIPPPLRPLFFRWMQGRIARADRRCPPAVRDRDACVYVVVARRPTL